jgi:hypothetical protein
MEVEMKNLLILFIILIVSSCSGEFDTPFLEYDGIYEVTSLKEKENFTDSNWDYQNNINFFKLESSFNKLRFLSCDTEDCYNEKEDFTIDDTQEYYETKGVENICIITKIEKELRDTGDGVMITITQKDTIMELDEDEDDICSNPKDLIEKYYPIFNFKKIEVIEGRRVN